MRSEPPEAYHPLIVRLVCGGGGVAGEVWSGGEVSAVGFTRKFAADAVYLPVQTGYLLRPARGWKTAKSHFFSASIMLTFRPEKFTHLELEIEGEKIAKITDLESGIRVRLFPPMATADGQEKLYLLKQGKEFIYVGVTKQNVRTRFWYGLTASTKRPYLYKWRTYPKLQLFIWAVSHC